MSSSIYFQPDPQSISLYRVLGWADNPTQLKDILSYKKFKSQEHSVQLLLNLKKNHESQMKR